MASRMLLLHCSRVAPVDAQRGRSGEQAENPVLVGSTPIRYFIGGLPTAVGFFRVFD
jgi:hypothetical protein